MLKEAAEPPGAGYNSNPPPHAASLENVHTRLDALKVELEQSIRYHQQRSWFYGRLHNVAIGALMVIGWTISGAIAGNVTAVFGIGIAVVGALGLVLHLSRRTGDHEKLAMRYTRLASELRTEEPTPEHLRHWSQQERHIAASEPPIYWALKAACCNEVLQAQGQTKGLYNLGWLPRLLINVFKFDDGSFSKWAARK
jgi:hypothetical protein